MVHIEKIASRLGINKKYLMPYGKYISKIDLNILRQVPGRKKGKYVLVTAMTPTPLGEGKTVTTIGLSMALNKLGKVSCACLRQPSLGPVFGLKGGGAGGGNSVVLPMEDINLHFTGDFHAVGIAHNLASAFLDNSIFRGNKLDIDPSTVSWRRVIDVSDRSLRPMFDITAASELMAILALSKDFDDLRNRISNIVLASRLDGSALTMHDLKVDGSVALLLKDAIKPNLVQTIENTPCFVHTGPFGNIAHGSSSIIADKIALAFSEYVVTEAGFGADLGAEKFFDIKCRTSGFGADAVVLVCSVRAIKAHSGKFKVNLCRDVNQDIFKENIPVIEEGLCNLQKQIENARMFGVPVVVAINRFDSDTDKEIELVKAKAVEFGAVDCHVSEAWKYGSKGALDLAKSVVKACALKSKFKFLYPLDISIKEKIDIIAKSLYSAGKVEYSDTAEKKIEIYNKRGWAGLPICMAKTQLSLSVDHLLKGWPKDFVLPVRDVRASVGAGFLYALCADIRTMPGLPQCPAGENIDIDGEGNITGLF
ncbi:MAG: formate--tetrahydrofolate ligase [Candidatus Omnitrophota bacterium]